MKLKLGPNFSQFIQRYKYTYDYDTDMGFLSVGTYAILPSFPQFTKRFWDF